MSFSGGQGFAGHSQGDKVAFVLLCYCSVVFLPKTLYKSLRTKYITCIRFHSVTIKQASLSFVFPNCSSFLQVFETPEICLRLAACISRRTVKSSTTSAVGNLFKASASHLWRSEMWSLSSPSSVPTTSKAKSLPNLMATFKERSNLNYISSLAAP